MSNLFVTPWTVAHQAPLSKGFPKQEYWSGLPFPSPRDFPNPGNKLKSLALAGRFFTKEPPGKPLRKTPDSIVATGNFCPFKQKLEFWKTSTTRNFTTEQCLKTSLMRLVGILIDVCIKKKKNWFKQPKLNPGQKDLGGRSARCFRTRTSYCSRTLFKTKLLSFWAGRQMDTKPGVTALILTPKGSHSQREAGTTAGRGGRWKDTKSPAAM